jgi:hypothetical protein
LKVTLWLGAALVGLFVAVMALQMVASESGEVVVLTTTDAAGAAQETRLWVVDYDGSAWLRAGSDQQGWYGRLVQQPQVKVERAGATSAYTAQPIAAETPEINRLMAEKYGWADRFIGMMFPRENAVAIRLAPALPSG